MASYYAIPKQVTNKMEQEEFRIPAIRFGSQITLIEIFANNGVYFHFLLASKKVSATYWLLLSCNLPDSSSKLALGVTGVRNLGVESPLWNAINFTNRVSPLLTFWFDFLHQTMRIIDGVLVQIKMCTNYDFILMGHGFF